MPNNYDIPAYNELGGQGVVSSTVQGIPYADEVDIPNSTNRNNFDSDDDIAVKVKNTKPVRFLNWTDEEKPAGEIIEDALEKKYSSKIPKVDKEALDTIKESIYLTLKAKREPENLTDNEKEKWTNIVNSIRENSSKNQTRG